MVLRESPKSLPYLAVWIQSVHSLNNTSVENMGGIWNILGEQIVINSYVYMFFNCDQSWIKSYLLCYFWRPFPIILETKHNWKSSLGDQPPRFSNLEIINNDNKGINTIRIISTRLKPLANFQFLVSTEARGEIMRCGSPLCRVGVKIMRISESKLELPNLIPIFNVICC